MTNGPTRNARAGALTGDAEPITPETPAPGPEPATANPTVSERATFLKGAHLLNTRPLREYAYDFYSAQQAALLWLTEALRQKGYFVGNQRTRILPAPGRELTPPWTCVVFWCYPPQRPSRLAFIHLGRPYTRPSLAMPETPPIWSVTVNTPDVRLYQQHPSEMAYGGPFAPKTRRGRARETGSYDTGPAATIQLTPDGLFRATEFALSWWEKNKDDDGDWCEDFWYPDAQDALDAWQAFASRLSVKDLHKLFRRLAPRNPPERPTRTPT